MTRRGPTTIARLPALPQPGAHGVTLPGTLSATGWQVPSRLSEDEWIAAGLCLSRIEGAVQWWLGDWWVHGEHAYGERVALFEPDGPLEEMNFQTVKQYGWVANSVKACERSHVLSWYHHFVVAHLEPVEQRRWLQRAVEGNGNGKPWSSKELKRAMAQEARLAAVVPTEATIVRADYRDWLATQPPCDLLLTDPLYLTEFDDDIAALAAFANEWLPVALAKVKPTGRAIFTVGAYLSELATYERIKLPAHMLPPRFPGVWPYRNTIGSQPLRDFKLNWQAILHYRGVDAPPLNCPLMTEQFSVVVLDDEQLGIIDNIRAPDGRQDDRWHTFQKPDPLCELFVRLASQPGDLVLDPFAGTGSFILAAARLGRVARGCDISPEMVALAKSRGCR